MASAHRLTLALQPGALLTLEQEPTPSVSDNQELRDLETELEPAFAENPALFLIKLGLAHPSLPLSPSLHFWREFSSVFCRKILLLPDVETLREKAHAPLPDADIRLLLDVSPPMSGSEYLGPEALRRYWEEFHQAFQSRITGLTLSVEDWFNSISGAAREIGRIHFHLVENRSGEFPFAFLATYGSHVGTKGRTQHLPLRHALEEFGGDARKQLQALRSIHRAAKESPWLKKLLDSGEIFHPLAWTPTQAHRFLMDVAIFSEAGILCRIPDWWRGARKGPRMRVLVGDGEAAGLGMDALLDFRPELTLDGEVLTEAELRRLAEAGEELAFIKGKWMAVDAEKITRSLDLFKRAQAGQRRKDDLGRSPEAARRGRRKSADGIGGRGSRNLRRRLAHGIDGQDAQPRTGPERPSQPILSWLFAALSAIGSQLAVLSPSPRLRSLRKRLSAFCWWLPHRCCTIGNPKRIGSRRD